MRLGTAIFAAALAMTGITGAAAARDGSLDDGSDGRGGGRGDAGTDVGRDDGRDHGDYDTAELSCAEAYGGWGREQHQVTVADQGGRLIATVELVDDWGYGRILIRTGVDLRPAGGRDLDTLYVGRGLKIALDSYTGDGLLDYTLNGRRTRVALTCY